MIDASGLRFTAIDWTRGLTRVVIVLVVAYWLTAFAASYSAYYNQPAPEGHFHFRAVDGRTFNLDIEGGACTQALGGITRALRQEHGAILQPNQCALSERNGERLRRREGAKAAGAVLAGWAAAFVVVGGILAAGFWIGSGFADRPRPDDNQA
jgi:hypothetical protein